MFPCFSWREGVVTEKNKKDETLFTVRFQGLYDLLTTFEGYMLTFIEYRAFGMEMSDVVVLPAVQGETETLRAWNLRPSLIWKDGEWVEWSTSPENNQASHEVLYFPCAFLFDITLG